MGQYLWVSFLLLCFACAPAEDNKLPPAGQAQGIKSLASPNYIDGNTCRLGSSKLIQGSCKSGFVCVPLGLDKQQGVCLLDCGQNRDGYLVKREYVCPVGKLCMLVKNHELLSMGMFCQTPQPESGKPCLAPFDENACSDGLSCLPTASFEDDQGKTIYGLYRCKQECSIEKPCKAGPNKCHYHDYSRTEKQRSAKDGKSAQQCQVSKCAHGDNTCPCNGTLGYMCQKLMDGLDVGNCVRPLGTCEEL